MKNKLVKMMAVLTATTMVAAGVIGCGDSNTDDVNANADTQTTSDTDTTAEEDTTNDTAELSGTVTLAGSTSMEKLANALAEAFMEKNPNVSVTAEFTGSSAGLESLAAGSVDIGDASRALSDDEKATGAVENIVAIDGIAMITDTANTVTDISSEDLAKVYKGEITNWKDLGGADEQIVVIGREAGSGTRDAFEELMDVKDACKYAQELDSTGAVLAKVAATPGAIGYVSLDVVDDTVLALQLNSVDATEENILKGDYVLQRPFVMATMGEITEQNANVQAFFDFIHSAEGQEVIKSVGLIIPQ
ncbi:MAG: phosphate ABC transporter substrate-binding protein [Lachnospiraceae bacterium]|nr:phosphate ABC transporter substrate-binding protein [Agathobacter sp.]MDD6292180.1 phosphate ABC transporter substrate-binding protein [Lachnospiraceae bacterium]